MTQTLIEALDDAELFGGMFDAPSWDRWKVFLRALFGLPMDQDHLAIFTHHTARTVAPDKASRYAELVVGRRGGKSRILALIATYLGCMLDHRAFIVPGETPVIAIIAKDRDQAKVIKNYIVGFMREIPAFADMIEDELAETVRLSNRVVIEVHTASISAPRGRTFLAVLCDESAFWPIGEVANPDVEVINAVRPGLSTIPYSLLLVASSPYAKRGILYTNYAKYFGVAGAPVLVWQGTTEEMNTTQIGAPLIAEMYAEDPERASAEFGALFRSDIVAFITREAIEDVMAPGLREIPPCRGVAYLGFVDPSGGSADSMTLAVAHLDPDGIAVLDCVRERKPPFSPDDVAAEFSAVLKSYGVSRVTGDAYAGHWPRERFAVHGITYDVSKEPKSDIYRSFLPALNGRRVRLLDIPRLTFQLAGLERKTVRGGRDKIDHADGSHDDVANAVCGALVRVIDDRRPALIRQDQISDEDSPALHRAPNSFVGTIWVGVDGMAAFVIFSHSMRDTPKLVVMDFGVLPWSSGLLLDISTQLDAHCEAARDASPGLQETGVHAFLHVQGQLYDLAIASMTEAFESRFDRFDALKRKIEVLPISEALLSDPVRLMLTASAIVAGGDIKLSAAAIKRSQVTPLMGALAITPGETVTTNALRVALLIGVAELDSQDRKQPAAKIQF